MEEPINQQTYPPIKEESFTLDQFKEKLRSITERLEKLKKGNTTITVVSDPPPAEDRAGTEEAAEEGAETDEERLKRLKAAAKARLDDIHL